MHYTDGDKRYILAPEGLKVGDKIQTGPGSDITIGNALPLKDMPLGSFVHNVELKPEKGGQLGRSAGASIQVMAKEGDYAQLKMPSGEVGLTTIKLSCHIWRSRKTPEQENISYGKAGRTRWKGKRPHVEVLQ